MQPSPSTYRAYVNSRGPYLLAVSRNQHWYMGHPSQLSIRTATNSRTRSRIDASQHYIIICANTTPLDLATAVNLWNWPELVFLSWRSSYLKALSDPGDKPDYKIYSTLSPALRKLTVYSAGLIQIDLHSARGNVAGLAQWHMLGIAQADKHYHLYSSNFNPAYYPTLRRLLASALNHTSLDLGLQQSGLRMRHAKKTQKSAF